MILPLLLLVPALLLMGIVTYGTSPDWAQYQHGLDIILMTRRLQWPLVIVAVLLCLILIATVISGKRRAWWLIGLVPILALFIHRFADHGRSVSISDTPAFVSAADASSFVRDEDFVVGLQFGETYYAYPYTILYTTPVVVQPDQSRRMMLLWSPFANRAVAYSIDRQIKTRELEIVSMPANALLLYNSRFGQFINGLTGLTTSGVAPIGFNAPIPTSKMRWRAWRELHPKTKVLSPQGRPLAAAASSPLLPYYKLPPTPGPFPPDTAITLIATTQPVAVPSDQITDQPANLQDGAVAILLFRDHATGQIRAYSRDIGDQMTPLFHAADNPARDPSKTLFVDADTHSTWDTTGRAVSGILAKKKQSLTPIDVEDNLYWGPMKFWYPDLKLLPVNPQKN